MKGIRTRFEYFSSMNEPGFRSIGVTVSGPNWDQVKEIFHGLQREMGSFAVFINDSPDYYAGRHSQFGSRDVDDPTEANEARDAYRQAKYALGLAPRKSRL